MLMQTEPTLTELEDAAAFQRRHIGPSEAEQAHMLRALGQPDLEALMREVIPAGIRRARPSELPPALGEEAALAELRHIAAQNRVMRSFIGQGYANAHMPGVIQRNVLENPAWYTAYTPYQPEISQGRLEALINFQTMVTDLTGLDVANASMLDEATAAAEAMTLALRSGKSASRSMFVADDVLPQTLEVLRTRARPLDLEVVVGPASQAAQVPHFAVLLQYPGVDGGVDDHRALIAAARAQGAVVIVAADILALTLLTSPGELGADIAVGNTQRFGLPLGFGGPHAAYLAVRDGLKRQMPGRLVGVSVDSHGQPAYRLALQTREQHIRREKATSNICTAQVLPAVLASMYAVYHGPQGLRRIAQRVHVYAVILADALQAQGWSLQHAAFFDTLTVLTGIQTAAVHAAAVQAGINLRHAGSDRVGVALDETVTREDLLKVLGAFAQARGASQPDASLFAAHAKGVAPRYPLALARISSYLTHPVFNRHHSETEMLRYLRRLADKDIALDRAMIPLGSCTMKLNATSEMIPITWPEFGSIHPFAPAEQTRGYARLAADLEQWLSQATGYDAISLQPNAGSQGEYAGLLAIHAWHESRGETQRDICLIPSSAHGTNPASAQMAGMQVVVVACDAQGSVDLDDLRAKARQHAARLSACMITYPSTHGVFEPRVREICDIVHQHGGQVYVDGANMNAMVGLASPPEFGADVSHLNLHKTFCIPHGGGGPGVGPVAVRAHLAPFLPGHASSGDTAKAVGAVSSAALGNASVLPITWMYIRMMGADGLTAASAISILSANYMARRLAPHFPVLYTGDSGFVAHECILDLRGLKDASGISNEDVAKRLMDYGFHAPTMSFPVPGTLMIEPTESESLAEVERFVEAMIAIRAEIAQVEQGALPRDDNPLRAAPFTAAATLGADWPHPYSREQASFPVPALRIHKYWVPVGRIDNVWGDRNLQCACIPVSAYAEATQAEHS
ncbi:MAG: aminomethyl-transferring glycine dehydrogenase [Betaproteobacteria bacterium]|nr:aminomethyl-transferring glycine dehydrogenase [Betaproteobacteria bacterium]MDE2122055.1 aminomethyl-transferring glycine dehydrogenase [Betaproteobacteria bacterium]MDE2187239.1 aminomethyl-transferring glycine dehydrogenase [Betaproteobacteria bacterium]MDE2325152.1 aminomethyl-transferring glycine dehydrogenase [Betaproteobacteria bacterium]